MYLRYGRGNVDILLGGTCVVDVYVWSRPYDVTTEFRVLPTASGRRRTKRSDHL